MRPGGVGIRGLLAAGFSLVAATVSWLTTTESPTERPLRIWMFTPSLMPVLTGRGAAMPSMLTHTRLPLGFLPSARFLKDLGKLPGGGRLLSGFGVRRFRPRGCGDCRRRAGTAVRSGQSPVGHRQGAGRRRDERKAVWRMECAGDHGEG